MDNLKHTPGPWYADSRGYVWRRPLNDLYEYGGGVAGDKPLATVCKGWWGEGEQGYPVEANARLIAAAPELLAELQNIANANPREWDKEVRDQFQQWAQNRARAAIAKAEGLNKATGETK